MNHEDMPAIERRIANLEDALTQLGATMTNISDFMKQREKDNRELAFRMALEKACNVMRALKITIEEGDTDEALRMIDDALDVFEGTDE